MNKKTYIALMQNGMTQKEIAEKVGTSQPHVSDWLNGVKTPSSVNLRKLANAMNCSPVDLVMKLHIVNTL